MADTTDNTLQTCSTTTRPLSWDAAYAEYLQLRASSDALPSGANGEDDAVDAYCTAADHLIANVRAPSLAELAAKLDLIGDQFESSLIPEDAIEGLRNDVRHLQASDAFALTWLARWTHHGGSVTFDVQDPDKAWIGRPEYSLSAAGVRDELHVVHVVEPGHAELPEGTREEFVNDRHRANRREYDAAMRELFDFLEAMPGGIEAVKAAVRVNPAFGRSRQMED